MSALTWTLILVGVLLNAAAQLLLKAATSATGVIALSGTGLTAALPKLLSHPGSWGGVGCYAVSVVVWVLALSRAPVSIAYPMLSIGYIVNALLAYWLFGEPLHASKVAGIFVIIVGVYLLTRSPA
jgi:multidrug transporter EmrE-like cation transporter